MTDRFDDAVVGAGIVGLATARALALRGRRVAVYERSARAQGASIRNFGMLWPIGQPAGPVRQLALRSRALWLELLREAEIWHEPNGSLHLAHHDDEWQVLREFAEQFADGLTVELLAPDAVRKLCPWVRGEQLRGGLFSATEVCVDARQAAGAVTEFLASRHGVTFHFNTAVSAFAGGQLTAGGATYTADRLWVCTGDDLETLYPETLATLPLVRCKLQMLRTAPYANRMGPMLAAGLTLRHYANFAPCPTLPAVRARYTKSNPDYDRYGVHVMASQNSAGELVLGDSHEYGDAIEPYDKDQIDQLILDYLHGFLDVPDFRVTARWHGIYRKHPTQPVVVARPADGVVATVGIGGAGMTLSFGVTEAVVNETLGSRA